VFRDSAPYPRKNKIIYKLLGYFCKRFLGIYGGIVIQKSARISQSAAHPDLF
jgi:hypothetical protein